MKPSKKTKAAGGKGWDVIFPSITNRSNYEDPNAPGGIWLAPIDETRANLKAVIPSFLRDSIQLGAVYRDNRYLIPYDWGTEGITFNSKDLDLKDSEVSFGDLWRPEVKGKVAFRQKSVIMGTGLYLDATGVVKSNRMLDVYKSEQDARRVWSEITDWIIERKDWFGAFWNNATEATSAFKDAGVVIGQTWDTTGLLLAQEDPAYKYRAPKEGIITWLDSVGILSGRRKHRRGVRVHQLHPVPGGRRNVLQQDGIQLRRRRFIGVHFGHLQTTIYGSLYT